MKKIRRCIAVYSYYYQRAPEPWLQLQTSSIVLLPDGWENDYALHTCFSSILHPQP